MQVSVYQAQTLIGTAILEHLDPPMGVAFGPFTATDQYDRRRHANSVEGEYVADLGQALTVHDEYDLLKTASIAIEDWADPEIGNQLTVFFQAAEDFAARFSEHEDYRAYYAR